MPRAMVSSRLRLITNPAETAMVVWSKLVSTSLNAQIDDHLYHQQSRPDGDLADHPNIVQQVPGHTKDRCDGLDLRNQI